MLPLGSGRIGRKAAFSSPASQASLSAVVDPFRTCSADLPEVHLRHRRAALDSTLRPAPRYSQVPARRVSPPLTPNCRLTDTERAESPSCLQWVESGHVETL